jgi:hypothetical protein
MIEIKKKKVVRFFQKKNSIYNSYARITKKIKFLKNSNFFPAKIDKTADFYFTTQSYPEGTIFF